MLITASLCGTALAFYYLKEQYDYRIQRVPPGPTSIPFIGNVLSIDYKSPHLTMIELAKRYGDIFSLKVGSQRVVILNNAHLIREAYRGMHISHRPDFFSMQYLVGEKGFLTCKDEHKWQLHTAICKQAIRVMNSSNLWEKIHKEAMELVSVIDERGGKPFDPQFDLYIASLNIICNLVFGERYNNKDPELSEILDYSEEIIKVISPVHPVNAFPWLRHFPNKWFNALFRAKGKRDRILTKKYIEHVANFKEDNVTDMLYALLASTKEAVDSNNSDALDVLTPEHVITNMWLIFFAGTDTMANTLQWSLLYMAVFQKKQSKLQDELDNTLGKDGRVSLENKRKLPYLQAVIWEILRYCSLSVLGVPHAAAIDTHVSGYFIPKGTQVMANFWAIHHNEQYWDEPHEFMPERFLTPEGHLRGLSDFPFFMPFSTGQRRCMGQTIAQAELLVLLGTLLQKFTFELPEDVEADLEGEAMFSLIPKPYKIIARRRDV
ncbi:steroid 17-alpha-hydroxylase/17,20 lyase-like isoform X3 [Apostichopus japonicus]